MTTLTTSGPATLVDTLHFEQKVDRALRLIEDAWHEYGKNLVVPNSLGKDSCVVWHPAKRVHPDIRGFIVTTRYKPQETVKLMDRVTAEYPELKVFRNDVDIPPRLYRTDPDRCCDLLKVQPTGGALQELEAGCWVTGLRCTEGRTRTNCEEIERRDDDLVKLNPILIWHEREVWQYLGPNDVPVNPLYARGYRSLGCAPCTQITTGDDERPVDRDQQMRW